MLGRSVVLDNPNFKDVGKAVQRKTDYLGLMEAIAVDDPWHRFEARVEVAATSTNLDFLRMLDVSVVAEEMVTNNLLLEVSLFYLTHLGPA